MKRGRLKRKPLGEDNVYSNWCLAAPDGRLLCRCAKKRARWYLDRGLATEEEGRVARLLFEPAGRGTDEWSLAKRENACVCCGTGKDLTKHHVVPYLYRKNFPLEMKSKNSHDILLLCHECHDAYERKADGLKARLAEEAGGGGGAADHRVVKMARTLLDRGESIPEGRRSEMLSLCLAAGASLEEVAAMPNPEADSGCLVVERAERTMGLAEFCRMWRRHFVAEARPEHLPEWWMVEL